MTPIEAFMTPTEFESEIAVFETMWNVIHVCRSCARSPAATAEVGYVGEMLWVSLVQTSLVRAHASGEAH